MRIFLSYGHDIYASLAARIKHDLETQHHSVWFDVDRLKPGDNWERYIEDGLDFASAVPGAGRFLLLMTPHSVRRPDGYCLNELSLAYGRNLPIIPVMVSDIEPPLSIRRLQWLDMRRCFPAEQHAQQYADQFVLLVKALEQKQVPFEGVQQRLIQYLQPLSYDDDLARYLLRFTGREWLMAEVEAWLDSSRCVLWVTGDAGVGKSAFSAWVCDKLPEVAAYHFCHFGNSDRADARRVLFSLAYQLSTKLPFYQHRLNASRLDESVAETNVPAIFRRLFLDPLTGSVPVTKEPQVMLIDALDEATTNGRNELAELIGSEFERLPNWIRLIVTSRPYEKEVTFALQRLDAQKLNPTGKDNLDDIAKYLRTELQTFAGGMVPSDRVVKAIIDRSEGLFLYASWVRQELQDGHLSLDRVEEFPRGLGGVYAQFFRRYFPDPKGEYASECRPALEAICAAREPLDRKVLAALLGRSEYDMRSLMGRLGSLFPVVEGRVRAFHQSVRDWLIDPDRSGDYWIDVTAHEQRFADFAWREYKSDLSNMPPYFIRYAPSHFAACHRTAELKELLLDPAWMEAKLERAGVVALLSDYELGVEVLPRNVRALLTETIRRSAMILVEDPSQLTSQILGCLVSHPSSELEPLLERARGWRRRPWFRPLTASLLSPGNAICFTLEGHEGSPRSVAITKDGRWAASAGNSSPDQTIRIWDAEHGLPLHTLRDQAESGGYTPLAFSPEGDLLLCGFETVIHVWDRTTGTMLFSLAGHKDRVAALAVATETPRAVSASPDGSLYVWDLTTRSGRQFATCEVSVAAVAISADGRYASALLPSGLARWDVDSGRLWFTNTKVDATSGLPKLWLSNSLRGDVVFFGRRRWEPDTDRITEKLSEDQPALRVLAVSADGEIALLSTDNRSVEVWDYHEGTRRAILPDQMASVYCAALTLDGSRAVVGLTDHRVRIWDVSLAQRELGPPRSQLRFYTVAHDGMYGVAWFEGRDKRIWDLTTGSEVSSGDLDTSIEEVITATRQTAISSMTGKRDERMNVLSTGQGVTVLTRRQLKKTGEYEEPDQLEQGSQGYPLWIQQEGAAEPVMLIGHSLPVTAACLSGDGRWVISGSIGRKLRVWDVKSGRQIKILAGHKGTVYSLAPSANTGFVVSASEDRTVKVWDLTSSVEVSLATFTGEGRMRSCSITPDGKTVIAVEQDGRVHILKLEGTELGV